MALALCVVALSLCAATVERRPGFVRVTTADYTLRASAVRSNLLPEATLREHGLAADDLAVLLNVTVMHEGRNVPAEVQARAINLAQQVEEVEMHATRANDLVSYTGISNTAPTEVLRFEIEVLPEGASDPIHVEFQESFGLGTS